MSLIRRTPRCRDALPTKQDLSPARRRMLEKLQKLNFGQIRNLKVQGGEPVFAAETTVHRHVKFGGDNGPATRLQLEQFALHAKFVELFGEMTRLQNGWIDQIEVRHGLPMQMVVREEAA